MTMETVTVFLSHWVVATILKLKQHDMVFPFKFYLAFQSPIIELVLQYVMRDGFFKLVYNS
ncbi:hypothetical protein QQP08_020922 [Theobroma cacao]|nr:hypothetical protein QQP08_020922 [Theobroma cacao]